MHLVLLAFLGCGADPAGRPTTIPDDAVELAPDVWWLGRDVDPASSDDIEGLAFVDRRPEDSAEAREASANARPSSGYRCWKELGYGGWPAPEPWGLDATNSSGLSATEERTEIENAHGVWAQHRRRRGNTGSLPGIVPHAGRRRLQARETSAAWGTAPGAPVMPRTERRVQRVESIPARAATARDTMRA